MKYLALLLLLMPLGCDSTRTALEPEPNPQPMQVTAQVVTFSHHHERLIPENIPTEVLDLLFQRLFGEATCRSGSDRLDLLGLDDVGVIPQPVEQLRAIGLRVDRLQLHALDERLLARAVGLGLDVHAALAFPDPGHAGQRPDPSTGARATPIFQTAAYVFQDTDQAASLFNMERAGHVYSRVSNPTTAVLEERIAALDGGIGALATASGQAALHLAV